MATPTTTVLSRVIAACCIMAGLLLFARQCCITYQDSVRYGGTDLRVRIVGSRLLANGSSPYFSKWQAGGQQTLADPNDNFDRPVNGVTVTPLLLFVQKPLAKLAYPQIRICWWVIQQALLSFVILFFVWLYKGSRAAVAPIVLAAGLLINSPFWFLHADRGQVYILYAAWMTVLFALWHCKEKTWIMVAGIWLAAGILLRPPLGIFAFVSFLLLNNKNRFLLVVTCACCMAVIIPLCGGVQLWQQYFDAMNIYAEMALHNLTFPAEIKPAMPATIEGASNLALYKDYSFIIYLGSLHNYFAAHGWQPGSKVYMAIFLLPATALVLIFQLLNKRKKATTTQYFMLAILLYTMAEVCQPLRMPYNLIQWLPALLAAVGYTFGGQRKPQ